MSDMKIGSSEWWTATADKVINTGLEVIQTKLQGVDNQGTNAPYVSTTKSSTNFLPYAIGAVAIGAVLLILAKR